MKYVLLLLLMIVIAMASCKKTNSFNANVLFYNASWSVPAVTAAWNGNDIVSTGIAQGRSSGTADSPYVQVPAGTNLITVKAGSTALLNKNIYASAATGSSFIIFDTSASSAPARIIQLTDDLTLPDSLQIKLRQLYMVPDLTVKFDTWLVNGTIDSIRLDSAGYFAGSTLTASSIQAFTAQNIYGTYTIKVKKTATNQVYASVANYPFLKRGIYSIVFSGLPAGTGAAALQLSVLHHHTQ